MFIAPFVPSPPQVVREMLALAELKAGEVFFDLGAGDGRTVLMAAKECGARAVGVELREDLAKKALSTIYEQSLQDRITIVNGDLFKTDLGRLTLFFFILQPARTRR